MNATRRSLLCLGLLSVGVGAQAGLERLSRIDRPPLRRPLAGLPRDLGGWVGVDLPVPPEVLAESQATEYVSRSYTSAKFPGAALSLWVNYSACGDNMRHSPEICLPGQGWAKVESESRVVSVPAARGAAPAMRLGYSKGDQFQNVGFWYYLFGEGAVERWVRTLPITSRSSHGRTTRGSGMTVEVFWAGESAEQVEAFRDFAAALLDGLEPILPADRAAYYVP